MTLGRRGGIWPEPHRPRPLPPSSVCARAESSPPDDRAVALLTASGLKDTSVIESALPPAPVVKGGLPEVMKALHDVYGFAHG